MTNACVEKLLKENEKILLRERRAVDRKSFTRPVTIVVGRNRDESYEGFSRDISSIGIGVISRVNWQEGTRADLTVHSLSSHEPIRVAADVRWTEPYGTGWFITGWNFVDA